MKVLVCGSTGCIGAAVVHALRARGHKVVEASRQPGAAREHWPLDFARPVSPQRWAERLRDAQVDTVVNCVGILTPSRGQRFERVHAQGPIELFRGAALAGVRRVIQVSALGAGPDGIGSDYLHSKLLADDLLATLPLDWAVLRPSLVYGPRSASAALFATLAALPVVSLPGRGAQRLQPLHVYELAEAIARLVEQPGVLRSVCELGGPESVSYREMLAGYRTALGLGKPLWLPLPMPLMKLAAHVASVLPQKSFSPETLRLLERGSVPTTNALPTLLGRSPTSLAQGLRISPPEPRIDLRGSFTRAVSLLQKLTIGVLAVLLWIAHTR
jgi:uncharacterized protein YbjT (DUF2867 family)